MSRALRLLILIALPLSMAGCGVNDIPTHEEQARAAWAQVQNQYQRRADLIPNLVETVKGFAAQESEVLVAVTEARASVGNITLDEGALTNPEAMAAFEQAQAQLTSALSRLMVTVERYPDLKSSQSFLALQSQLEGTENRIAVARQDFIDAVRVLNTELRTIPGRWWHALLYPEVQPMATFTAQPEAGEVPEVDFSS